VFASLKDKHFQPLYWETDLTQNKPDVSLDTEEPYVPNFDTWELGLP
jgi:hypothetical protein